VSNYGRVAVSANGWLNQRVSDVLAHGLPPLPPTVDELRNFNPLEPRDDDGKWTEGAAGAVANAANDLLGLAERIKLGDDEHLVASGKFSTHSGYDVDIMHAVIDTPGGRQIRIGLIPSHDAGHWTAADKGGTSVLSPRAAAHLRDDLTETNKRARAAAKKADAAAEAGRAPDVPIGDPIDHGSAAGGWTNINWSTELTDDDPTSWLVSLSTSRQGSDADPAVLTPKDVNGFVKQLDGLLGMARSASGLPDLPPPVVSRS
jgi:hypothetical protein